MKYIASLFEKVAWQYVQALTALALVGGSLASGGIGKGMLVAALPAAFTAFVNSLPQVPGGLPFYADLVFKVIRSAAAAFFGYLAAMPAFDLSIDAAEAAIPAVIVAVFTVLKGAAATRVGDGLTTATLPARLDAAASTTS